MKKPTDYTVICDVDGVLCDFIKGVQDICEREGLPIPSPDLSSPDVVKLMGSDRFSWVVNQMVTRGDHPELYDGGMDLKNKLLEHGDYLIATAPMPVDSLKGKWWDMRYSWLRDMGFAEDRIQYMTGRAKAHLQGCMLIEDSASTVEAWNACRDIPTGMLVKRPWNEGTMTLSGASRAVHIFSLLSKAA